MTWKTGGLPSTHSTIDTVTHVTAEDVEKAKKKLEESRHRNKNPFTPTELKEVKCKDELLPEEMIDLSLDERIKRFRTYHDTDGNKVIFSKRKKFWRVDLWLPHDRQKPNRCIGRIVETKKGVVYRVLKYMRDHYYRESNSFWFNDTLIHQVLVDDDKVVVRIKETGEVLETDVATIKQHGTYRRYKTSGLERQVFLSTGYFTSKN